MDKRRRRLQLFDRNIVMGSRLGRNIVQDTNGVYRKWVSTPNYRHSSTFDESCYLCRYPKLAGAGGLGLQLASWFGTAGLRHVGRMERSSQVKSSQVANPRNAFCIEQSASSKAKKNASCVFVDCFCCFPDISRLGWLYVIMEWNLCFFMLEAFLAFLFRIHFWYGQINQLKSCIAWLKFIYEGPSPARNNRLWS